MDKITISFIRASLIYLVIGATAGVILFFWPSQITIYRSIHAHINVVGWLSMLVFGVAYHILPRFSGQPLYSPRLAWTHLWLANIGLIGMVIFWAEANRRGQPFLTITGVFGFILALSFYFFVYNMWRTVKGVETK